jgi:anti-anti-sigma factor
MIGDIDDQLDAPHYSLRCEKETRAGARLYHCRGGFSLNNHALLDAIVEEIKAAPERKIVLDFGGIRYIDSVGIGTLASIIKHAMTSKIELVLVSNEVVDRMLLLSSMGSVMRVVHSVEEALAKAAP